MTTAYRIEVMGLREFNAAIKELNAGLEKHLRVNLKKVADVVVQEARGRMDFKHSTGEAAGSLKPAAGTAGAQPWAGIRRPKGGAVTGTAVYEPWLDFGGSTGRGHRIGAANSGAIKRRVPKGGQYLYPAITATADVLLKLVDDAVCDSARDAEFEIEGTA